MNLAEQLQRGSAQLGLTLADETRMQLLEYVALLHKWNKVYNLTAIRDPAQMVSAHLLDSLAVLPYLWPRRWLDVGCGAGLPGIVLAIVQPDWQFVLLDSNSKKTSFVQQVVIELGLRNVGVSCARAEAFEAQVKFDGIISRAFTELQEFFRLTRHLLAAQGRWAAMKGSPEAELANVPDDYFVERLIELHVPGITAARSLVIAAHKGSRTA
jgi:16S rRNA (guanine527-N7)-methyltransferase